MCWATSTTRRSRHRSRSDAGVTVGLVWAQACGGVIGADGGLPWRLPEDLARFRGLTMGATVLMGRATWESLPVAVRPLPGRRNVVLTRQVGWAAPGAGVAGSIEQALREAPGDVWVIGGGSIYAAALEHADRAVVTEIDLDVAGDTWAPELDDRWQARDRDPEQGWLESRTGLNYCVTDWSRTRP